VRSIDDFLRVCFSLKNSSLNSFVQSGPCFLQPAVHLPGRNLENLFNGSTNMWLIISARPIFQAVFLLVSMLSNRSSEKNHSPEHILLSRFVFLPFFT
jgi:hypothetical protein